MTGTEVQTRSELIDILTNMRQGVAQPSALYKGH